MISELEGDHSQLRLIHCLIEYVWFHVVYITLHCNVLHALDYITRVLNLVENCFASFVSTSLQIC